MKLLDEKEKTKINFEKTQMQKNYFLGEFKENVILAVKKEQLDGSILEEVVDAMKNKNATLLKIRRDIPLKKIKGYINEAEKIGIKYRLVDGLSFVGKVALVVVSKEALDDDREIMAKEKGYRYTEKGLCSCFEDAENKKICEKHYSMVSSKAPEYLKFFEKLGMMDKLFGKKCPVCEDERKGNR